MSMSKYSFSEVAVDSIAKSSAEQQKEIEG